jgi:hypothetical protein
LADVDKTDVVQSDRDAWMVEWQGLFFELEGLQVVFEGFGVFALAVEVFGHGVQEFGLFFFFVGFED